MPKGQQRSNREAKKPKQPKKPAGPAAPFMPAQGKPGGSSARRADGSRRGRSFPGKKS